MRCPVRPPSLSGDILNSMELTLIKVIHRGDLAQVDLCAGPNGERVIRKSYAPVEHKWTPSDLDKNRKRFVREIKIQSELDNDLVMPILASDTKAGQPWFVMPHADDVYDKKIERVRLHWDRAQ